MKFTGSTRCKFCGSYKRFRVFEGDGWYCYDMNACVRDEDWKPMLARI